MKLVENDPYVKTYLTHRSSLDPDAHLASPEGNGLRIGDDHYLSRVEVQEFVSHLIRWLQSGSLKPDP